MTFDSAIVSGLQVQVKLNATTIPQGGALAAQVSLFNTLDQNLSLSRNSSLNAAINNWDYYDFECGYSAVGELFAYALFSGHYAAENISLASGPLQLVPNIAAPCFASPFADGIVLLPNSDNGVLSFISGQVGRVGALIPILMNATNEYCPNGCEEGVGISGYWNTTMPVNTPESTFSPNFVPLPPGQYTLAALDAWGVAVYAHFQVALNAASPVNCPSHTICGSFTYSPTGQVQVDSVRATQQACQDCQLVNGELVLSFAVTFENTGSSPIYFLAGPTVLSTNVPGNATVFREVNTYVCAATVTLINLEPGQNYTLYGPSCGTGIIYQLDRAGSVNVGFSFNWGTTQGDYTNSTSATAEFIFP